MKKIYLIDSMAYIFRSFYAIRQMNASDGTPTNALFGFIKSMEKILKDFDPQYIVAVFDAGSKTFRNDIYPEYKTNRKECPEDLKPQFDLVKQYLKMRGIPLVIKEGFEADDLIGTLATKAKENNFQAVICSGDKDMMQLVEKNILMCQTHKENLMVDTEKVKEILGVRATQVIDYLAIVGDSSDNIPGLPGIGAKGASDLLERFGNLDVILASANQLKGKRQIEAVTLHSDKAHLSKKLATIVCDVPLKEKLENLTLQKANFQQLEEFYQRYTMNRLVSDLQGIKKRANQSGKASIQKFLENTGQACTLRMESLANTPFKNEILSLVLSTNGVDYNLLEESGKDNFNEVLLHYKDAFKEQDFTFISEQETFNKENFTKQKKPSFSFLVGSWLYDSKLIGKVVNLSDDLFNTANVKAFENADFNTLLKSAVEDISSSKTNYKIIQTWEQFNILLEVLEKAKEICLDTETTSLKVFEAELVGLGFCFKENQAFYLPFNGELETSKLIERLKDFFTQNQPQVFGQNIKYDYQVLKNHGITLKNIIFDTLLASYVINPSRNSHNLDNQALHYLNYRKIATKSLIGTGQRAITMDKLAIEQVGQYCCEDVDITYRLKKLQEKELKAKNLIKLFNELELPLITVLGDMEANGIFVDKDFLSTMSADFEQKILQIETNIFQLAGEKFNISSPKQVGEILFEKLELPSGKKTQSGYSTDVSVLEKLAVKSPIAHEILAYRNLTKLKSTYIDALPNEINPHTKRIHSSFSQTTAATGRLASNNPNLQNIPVRTEEGKKIRSAFQAKKGHKFMAFDYSQIELRIIAILSEDKALLKAFKQNLDIHTYTASLVFDIAYQQVTKEQRYNAKAVNFGIMYGQGQYGLAKELKIEPATAKEFIKNYFMRYPSIQKYMDTCKQFALEHGYVETAFGRRRYIPEIYHNQASQRAFAERMAINSPIQGTSADIIKKAMIDIAVTLKENDLQSRMLLQIHDELIFEVPDEEIQIMQKIIPPLMANVKKFPIELKIDCAVGETWRDCD